MRRNPTFGLAITVALGALAAGCGDNSKECGAGTEDKGGVCTPLAGCGTGTKEVDGTCVPDGSVVCTGGTIFDPGTGHCAIDPNSCQGDTVLIDGKCQDPTAGLHVDVEEGAEPNGLGVGGEESQAPAGIVALNPAGGAAFVVHGKIIPADHNGDGVLDNDYDTYVVNVTAPSLIGVTADGVHGLTGGFVALANVGATDPLAGYQRFGLNLTGDTAKRQLFLPKAGTYLLTIADSRTLFLGGSVAGAEAGHPAFEYFISINTLAIPTPTALAVANGIATSPSTDTLANDVKFFTTPMGVGLNEANLNFNTTSAIASIQVLANNAFRTLGDGQDLGNGLIVGADVSVGGFSGSDTSTFVVDFVYNYALQPFLYQLKVTTGTAKPLSTTGAKVTDPEHSDFPVATADYNQFYFDVAAANDTIGLAMTFDSDYDAALVDSNNQVVANFTWSGGFANGDTMTDYNGLLRFKTPGRYYFMVYDPFNFGTDTIGITSKLAKLTPAAVVTGTPLTAQAVSADYQALPFSYATNRATEPWQALTTTASAGAVAADFYNPASAYGRLDPITVNGATTRGSEAPRLYAGAAIGRILLDDPTDTVYVHVRPATIGATVSLSYKPRVFHDFMTVAAGATVAPLTGEATSSLANPPKFYFIKSAAGNRIAIAVTPTGATAAADDLQINLLNANESARRTVDDNTTPGTGESTNTFVAANGWIAFSVTTSIPTSTYTLTLSVNAPTTYTNTAGTTVFADACTGGTNQSLGGDTDEGSTNPIAAPANFKLFGVPVTSFIASANGLLAFVGDPATEPTFINEPLPALDFATSGIVAPFWTDLYGVTVCTKTVGGKLVVQWKGTECTTFAGGTCGGTIVVNTQAILDGATGTIEFVYGPAQQADGDLATVGIENTESTAANQLSFDTAGSVAPSTSKLMTPM